MAWRLLLLLPLGQCLTVDGPLVVVEAVDGWPPPPAPTKPPVELPLRLTPFLEAGDAAEARRRAAVPAMLPSCCPSFSGFLTVDKEHDSNLFFWFFRSETRRKTAPLVVWLQGGPGTSMMRPVFLENGPYQIDPRTMQLRRRRSAWTRAHSVLYFDNPVGTGYSFTRGDDGLARNVRQVALSLVEALRQFFVMFPGQRGRDLYIAGESYGGKMATALAHEILHSNSTAFNLQGLIIINALVEAESQIDKSEVAYQLGIVDEAERDEMRAVAARQIKLIQLGHWDEARKLSKDECGGPISPTDTGLDAVTNYLLWNGTQDNGYKDLAQHRHIRMALHVGNATFSGRATAVARALIDDVGASQLPQLAEVADNLRVLVVSGQLDLCLPYRLTANFLRKMAWSGASEMAQSRRVTWCVQGQLAGYARTVRGLTHVLVRNAGHYLGQDQPRWSADMLKKFTDQETFDTCEERCAKSGQRP